MTNELRIPTIVGGVPAWLRCRNANISSMTSTRTVPLDGRSIEVDSLRASISASTSSINIDRSRLARIYRGGSLLSMWYVTDVCGLAQNQWSITLCSPAGLLERRGHVGGVYNAKNAAQLIAEICGGANGVPIIVAPEFSSQTVSGWLPYVSPSGANGAKNGTAKDNLLQVLFALNALLRVDLDGNLRIENLPVSAQGVFSAGNIYRAGYSIEYGEPVSSVSLTAHSYIDVSASTAASDRKEVFAGTIPTGETRTIVFSQPMSDLLPAAAIVESGANYAVIGAGNWTASGDGVVTAVPYSHVERELTATVDASAPERIASVTDATLVNVQNGADILNRLVAFYQHTEKINFDAALQGERPGDVVTVFDKMSGQQISACIAAQTETFSQTLRGSISALVGFTPWQTAPFTDEVEILTGSGSWVVPDGVTSVTAVLIGGGSGGDVGADGEAAQLLEVTDSSSTSAGVTTHVKGVRISSRTFGNGGGGGAGGKAGKVLHVALQVTGGASIAFQCGTGGSGAKKDGSHGATDGTATTFGANTSADGKRTAYVEPTSGVVYAEAGDVGIDGGNGGGYDENGNVADPDVVFSGGVAYNPGAQGEQAMASGGRYNTGNGSFDAVSGGSFGGGAAVGADGADGVNGVATASSGGGAAASFAGGAGASASAPVQETIYGKGGRGGNGGGGGGSNAAARVRNAVGGSATYNSWLSRVTVETPANGGSGSDGGAGAAGCVILYYRKPVTV